VRYVVVIAGDISTAVTSVRRAAGIGHCWRNPIWRHTGFTWQIVDGCLLTEGFFLVTIKFPISYMICGDGDEAKFTRCLLMATYGVTTARRADAFLVNLAVELVRTDAAQQVLSQKVLSPELVFVEVTTDDGAGGIAVLAHAIAPETRGLCAGWDRDGMDDLRVA
jgi:hypothetical protein